MYGLSVTDNLRDNLVHKRYLPAAIPGPYNVTEVIKLQACLAKGQFHDRTSGFLWFRTGLYNRLGHDTLII
jgi:hypothetical protein